MTTDQFRVTEQPFSPRQPQTNTGLSQPSSDQTVGDINPYNVNVVRELVRRNRPDVAQSRYPTEYKALFGDQQTTQPSKVKIYNRSTDSYSDLDLGVEQATKYNPNDWQSGEKRFDMNALQGPLTDEEKRYAENIVKRVDYSQIGAVNGSKGNNAYKLFDNGAVLPNLFAKYLGMRPEEVLALNHYDRKEVSENLLSKYYDRANPAEQQQMGDKATWINKVIKHYGFGDGDEAEDGLGTMLWNFGEGAAEGIKDQFSNFGESIKTFFGGNAEGMSKEEIEAEKARRRAREGDRTKSEKALLQRFDSLMEDGRYTDAAWLAVSNPDMYGALMGTTVGGLIADAGVAAGITWGTAAAATYLTGGLGGGVAGGAATAATAANVARFANALAKLAKAGTYVGVSGLGMHGALAKEIMLDGNTIPVGSEVYNTLAAYGVLGAVIPVGLGGTIENTIAKKILSSSAGKGLSEEAANNIASKAVKAMQSKGYEFTEEGVKRSLVRGGLEWGGKVAYRGSVEPATEYVQESAGEAIKQAANQDGTVDYSNVDADKVHKAGMRAAVVAAPLGAANTVATTAPEYFGRSEELSRAENAYKAEQATIAKENAYKEWRNNVSPEDIASIRSDVEFGLYDADGNRLDVTDPYTAPSFKSRKEKEKFIDDVTEKLLRRRYEEEQSPTPTSDTTQQPTEPSQGEPGNFDFMSNPFDPFNPFNTPQQPTDVNDDLSVAQDLNNSGMDYLYTEVSPVKDLRQYNTATDNVDKMWGDVRKDIETWQNGVDKEVKDLNAKVDEIKSKDLSKFPEQLRNQYEEKLTTYQNRIDELEKTKTKLEQKVRNARGLDDVQQVMNIASGSDGVIHTVRGRKAVAQLNERISHANNDGYVSYYTSTSDSASRFSMADRAQVQEELVNIANMAGVEQVNGDLTDLPDLVNTYRTAITTSRYANSPRAQKALMKLNAVEKAITHNRPEMLGNLSSVNKRLSGVSGIRSDKFSTPSNSVVLGGHKRYIETAISTAKNKGTSTGKVSSIDPQLNKQISDMLKDYEYHPLETVEDIHALISNYHDALVQTNDQSNIQQRASLLGILANLNDIITDLKGDQDVIRTPRNSATRQYVTMGDKIYDPVLRDMSGAELSEYVENIKHIEKVFGITGIHPPLEENIGAHVANLRQHLQQQRDGHGAPMVYKRGDQFVAKTLFEGNDKFRYGNELTTGVDTYLAGVENRVKSYETRQNNPNAPLAEAVSLETSQYGDLVQAVIDDTNNPSDGGKAIRDWVKQREELMEQVVNPTDEVVETSVSESAKANIDAIADELLAPAPIQMSGSTDLALIEGRDYTPTKGVTEFDLAGLGRPVALNPTHHGQRKKVDEFGAPLSKTERAEASAHNRARQQRINQFTTPRRTPEEKAEYEAAEEQAYQDRQRAYNADQREADNARQQRYENAKTVHGHLQGNLVSMGVNGSHGFIPKYQAMVNIYRDAVKTVGNDATAIAEYINNALVDLAETNPNMFTERAIATISTTLVDINNIEAWLDSQASNKNKAKAAHLRNLFGEMNNKLLIEALEHGAVPLDNLTGLVGNMALWYQHHGYGNIAGLLSVVLDSKQFSGVHASNKFTLNTKSNGYRVKARRRGIAAQTSVVLLDGVAFQQATGLDPATTHGAYSLKRADGNVESIIYINREGNHDIAATLAHELGHVAWAELFGNTGWTVGDLIRKNERRTFDNALSNRNEFTEADVNELVEAGVVQPKNDGSSGYELTANGLEELIMHNLDSLIEQRNGKVEQNVYSKALAKLFGKDNVDQVLDLLSRRATENSNQLPRKMPEYSPVVDGFTMKARRKRKKRDEFQKVPNEDNPNDMTTVYHFGFHEDNQNVSADPMAWWDNNAWNFFYVDSNGNPNRTTGLSASEMLTMAQDLGLYIEQRERDIILQGESKRVDQFLHFSPPVARMWKGINRLFGGNDFQVSPFVRRIMSYAQKWAIEQHGADQFYKMFENVLTAVTGTDKEGVLTTKINEIRTRINHQLNNPGVGGQSTMHDLTNELIGFVNEIGWSEQKVNDVLYAMRAGEVFTRLHNRQKHDPKWKNKPFNPDNSTGFYFTDENGQKQNDPTGEKYLATLSDQDKQIANALRDLVINLNNAVIQIEFDSGRISQSQYEDQYGRFYVPLKNESDKATAFQRTMVGRHTKADRPLVHLIANHKARLYAVEQTQIYQAFMDLMEQYPIKGFATFNSASLKNKGDGEYAMEADGFIDGTAVTFYRGGEKVNMTITHPAMAAAIKKRKGQATSAYLDAITRATAIMGLTRTALPTFAKTAFFRDLGMAFFNVQGAFRGKEKMNDFQWAAMGIRVARDMVRYLPMIAKSRFNMDKADWRYKVYRSEGGIGTVTGYDVEGVNAALERDIFKRKSIKSRAQRAGRTYLDVLHASDDAARFSLWMNYLEKKHGKAFTSEAELLTFLRENEAIANIARDASKNITGNFEQRGMSRGFRSHFIFWDAIQAGMRNIYGLLNPRYGTYGIKGLSALMAFIMMSGDDEEDADGKSKESRMKGLGNNLQIGDMQVNLAQELRPFSHLAESIKFYFRGDWDLSKAVSHYANGLAQAVVPWQMAETGDTLTDAAYALTPTMLQPLVLNVAGKNYFGGELSPAPYDTDGKKWEDAPDAFRRAGGITNMSSDIAQAMYHFTGGAVDVAPGSLDMLMQQFGGSIFSIAKDISKRVENGEGFLGAGVSQFTKGHIREYNDFALRDEVNERFKDAMRKHKVNEDGLILGKSDLSEEATALNDLFAEMGKEIKSITGEDGESKMTDLYTQLDKVKASDSPSPDEFLRITSQIEQLRQTRNVIYGKYNRILMEMGY